jgi:hypothetical protein
MENIEKSKIDVEKAKSLMIDLFKSTDGKIHPLIVRDEKVRILCNYIIINKNNAEGEKWNEESEKLLNELVDTIIIDKKDFYNELVEFGYKKWDEYKKREKMHYIYKCEIGIPKKDINGNEIDEMRFKLYDMSILKMQNECSGMYQDDNYYKTPPDWIKDIKRFTTLLLPINMNTVFLYNPEEDAIIDLRKEEMFLIPL